MQQGQTEAARQPSIINYYPRALHHALLETCGVEATREFWGGHPLVLDGRACSSRELARHLDRPREKSPLAWVVDSQNGLEDFLLARGIGIEAFMTVLLQHTNRASFIPSRVGLGWISPLIAQLFRSVDPYRVLLRMSMVGGRLATPGIIFQELRSYKLAGDARAAMLLLTYPELWLGRLPAWDAPVFTALMQRRQPRALGLPSFDRVHTVADARRAEDVARAVETSRHDGGFWIEGTRYGSVERFSVYCQRHGVSMPALGQPDPEVIVISTEWYCPRRQRVVLNKGCAYGSPGYLLRFEWRVPSRRSNTHLQHLLNEVTNDPEVTDAPRLKRLHAAFAGDATITRCKYNARQTAIYANDKYLCRGVPALILRHCLNIRGSEGRVTFEYREFKQDNAFISHPKNTGFEVRLARLRDTLKASDTGLAIEQTEPGRFTLRTDGVVTLEETV